MTPDGNITDEIVRADVVFILKPARQILDFLCNSFDSVEEDNYLKFDILFYMIYITKDICNTKM